MSLGSFCKFVREAQRRGMICAPGDGKLALRDALFGLLSLLIELPQAL